MCSCTCFTFVKPETLSPRCLLSPTHTWFPVTSRSSRVLHRQSGDPFDAVCDGCETPCDGCRFEDPNLARICLEVMPHATSAGGVATVETISLDPGFWRATASSTEVLACYKADACLGGVTGTAGFCLEGYGGPCGWLCFILNVFFVFIPLLYTL